MKSAKKEELRIFRFAELGRALVYRMLLRLRLRNVSPSIIANNCTAGIIYHDLGLKFRSPTINLYFETEDYHKFLRSLEHYVHCIPEPVADDPHPFPVGVLRKEEEEVKVYFMHYASFEEARDKWVERGARVNLDNLYVLWEYPSTLREKDRIWQQFRSLDFKHKRLLTDPVDFSDEEAVPIGIYRENYRPGLIFAYVPGKYGTRYLNRFDYVRFLNQK